MISNVTPNRGQNTNFGAIKVSKPYEDAFRLKPKGKFLENNFAEDALMSIKGSLPISSKDVGLIARIRETLQQSGKTVMLNEREVNELDEHIENGSNIKTALTMLQQCIYSAKDIPDATAEKATNVMNGIRATANRRVSNVRDGILA